MGFSAQDLFFLSFTLCSSAYHRWENRLVRYDYHQFDSQSHFRNVNSFWVMEVSIGAFYIIVEFIRFVRNSFFIKFQQFSHWRMNRGQRIHPYSCLSFHSTSLYFCSIFLFSSSSFFLHSFPSLSVRVIRWRIHFCLVLHEKIILHRDGIQNKPETPK